MGCDPVGDRPRRLVVTHRPGADLGQAAEPGRLPLGELPGPRLRSRDRLVPRRAAVQEKRKRTGARQFLKEVRLELKKVDWPTRQELITYSTVVLVTITVLTFFVFGVDYLFTRFVFPIFN